MEYGQSIENPVNDQHFLEGITELRKDPLPFLSSELQLQNVFAIEMAARRFLVDMDSMPVAQLSIEDVEVNDEIQHAQAVLSVNLEFSDEPHPFDISFKLLGLFAYAPQLKAEEVISFLEMGSLSVMLPFAREFLLSICTRFQISPIMLSMIKLAPPPSLDEIKKEDMPR
jgi:preprotein translocase subunit SecB